MRNVYTVKQVNAYVKNMFAQDFMLNRIYVKGEVSNLKYHTSGHIYFSLKDESGTIACVMFAGQRNGLSFRMKEGQQIVVLGTISVYERDGKYQLYAKEIILDGDGLLYEKFQQLKTELEEMGMFAPEYKQVIPRYVKTVGIVTAPTGAAVRDIINIAQRRNPYVQLILYPAKVQGTGAAQSIISGIRALEQQNVDVMIVGRGGGSIEDLWAFNEECVARAVFECSVPIISAVGHETDTTIIDYVSDLRAPTPSAAAELAVYEYRNFQEMVLGYRNQMLRVIQQKIRIERLRSEKYKKTFLYLDPKRKLWEQQQRITDYEERLRNLMSRKINDKRQNLILYTEKIKHISPLEKLKQGFSFIQNECGKPVKSISDIGVDDTITIFMTDGYVKAQVNEIQEENKYEDAE